MKRLLVRHPVAWDHGASANTPSWQAVPWQLPRPQPQVVCRVRGGQPAQCWGVLPKGDLSTNHAVVLNIVKEEPQYSKNPVVMVDEVMSSSPPKFSFPEAGLRIMITNKFGPRTRLRMASRIIINEVSLCQGH